MIESIHVEDFQSHPDTTLEFCPGVNVIVGRSDSGKTALLRALRWLSVNRPAGEAYIAAGAKLARVTTVLGDGTTLVRAKGGSTNEYIVGDQVLKAFGQDVPEEVAAALNLSGINWQTQMDPPFLLSQSPGEVARQLNEIVNLEVIDHAHTRLTGRVRSTANSINQAKAQVDDLERDLVGYRDLDRMDGEVTKAEKIDRELDTLGIERRKLGKVVAAIAEAGERLAGIGDLSGAGDEVDELSVELADLEEARTYHRTLQDALSSIARAQGELDTLSGLPDDDTAISKALGCIGRLDGIRKRAKELKTLVGEIRDRVDSRGSMDRRIAELEEWFHEAMPDECPLCGRSE